jgi:hypothetical protein
MIDYANTLFIHHHLGLGDHVVCNGMVRFILKNSNYETIRLVTKNKYEQSVTKMYRDEPRIVIHPVNEDADFYTSDIDWKNINLVRAGFERCRKNDWAMSLYDSVGIAFIERWKSFCYERDKKEEQELIDSLNLPNEFILVHDVSSVGKFNLTISSNLPVISVMPIQSFSVFSWLGVVERASEVHCIDSSFAHIIESFEEINENLFFHDVKNDGVVFPRLQYWNFVSYDKVVA